MNFSLDWFLSIPGLLITGGVLLLLIALIILIVTSRKKKDKNDSTAATEPAQATATTSPEAQATPAVNSNGAVPEMNSPAMSTGTIMDIPAPVGTGQNIDPNANMNNAMPMSMPTTEPVVPVDPMAAPTVQATPEMAQTMGINEMPAVAPVAPTMETPVAPAVEPIAPAMETPVAPAVEPVAPTMETPVVPTVEQAAPTMEASVTPVAQQPAMPQAEQPVIYGGANPIVPEINIQEPQHQIYGGANPLENTQSIPISNLVGPNQQPVVQTPAPEPTIVTEQPTPVVGQPTNMGQ